MDQAKTVRQMTHEFFRLHPDYGFCRTLAENVQANVTTYPRALGHLAQRAQASRERRGEIQEKLDRRSVRVSGQNALIKDLTLRRIMDLDDEALAEVVGFYFKHPYAHGRTRRSRWLPSWMRTLFLRALLGHAKRREIPLDYEEFFEVLRLL